MLLVWPLYVVLFAGILIPPAFPPAVTKGHLFQGPTSRGSIAGSFGWKPDGQQGRRRHVLGDTKHLFDLFLKSRLTRSHSTAQPEPPRRQ